MSKKKSVKKKTRNKATDVDPELAFEDALEQLEALIERVESGEAGLEESIEQYARGTALIRRCRSVLDAAEQRITELTGDDFEKAQ